MFWCFGKTPRNYHCKIVLLDDTEFIQDIQETSRGQQLLDVVFKHLNLMETAYFGLRFLDSSGQRHWLDPNKNVIKQMKSMETLTLYFGVKFYASDPCKLLEEITRYQFFLQVKQDIYQGRLALSYDVAAELFAYAIQSELGDFDPRRHSPGYAGEFNFIPNQSKDLESRAADIHKGLCGTVPAVAEISFLDRIKWLDMYGIDLHPVLGEDNIEYYLGLTPSGILVLRNKTKVGNYFWPRITKVYYKRKYFMIKARDKNNEQNTYGFELANKRACKHLWKCCSDHRTFFKLTQIREVPGHSSKMMGLEYRFYGNGVGKEPQPFNKIPRLRTPPTFVRVPSRRFHKRLGQPDGADAGTQSKEESISQLLEPSRVMSPIIPHNPVLIPVLHRSTSVPSVVPSPYKVITAPWEDPRLGSRGVYSSCISPSPRSVRSAGALPSRRYPLHGRTGSIDSTHSFDYRKRKHHHRRQSDNESEVSKSSRCSKSSKSSRHHRRHGSQNGDGSDSESQHRHKRHSRRKRHGSTNELVDSESQWKEVQRQLVQAQNQPQNTAVVRDLTKRRSGYLNSGLETESESNYSHRRRQRRHRSRSPDCRNGLPREIKKYIDYNLVDASSLTEDEKKDIKFTNVQSDNQFKMRYSTSQGHIPKNQKNIRSSNGNIHKVQSPDDPSPPPPYSCNPQNGFPQRLIDIEEKNENLLDPHDGNDNQATSREKVRNGSSMQPYAKRSQDWDPITPTSNLNRSQKLMPDINENGGVNNQKQNFQNLGPNNLTKGIRLSNGHFLPSAQKPLAAMPAMVHRVTFQSDGMPKQYSKNSSPSQPWIHSPSRANGEAMKSNEPQTSQHTHEMSTVL